jgi:predicted dehydrogenase
MPHSQIDRRTFLAGTAATVLGSGVFAASAPARSTFVSANEEVRVAILGAGWRGGQLAEAFSTANGCRLVAFADPDETLSKALAKKYSATAHSDLRKVLDDPNVDAVVISTCNHWHCLATLWALDAGKDVYVEKPLSHTQWEGRQVVNAAAKSDRIVAFGTQQRSDPLQAKAKKFLHEEKALGKIKYVQANRLGTRASVGKRATPLKLPKTTDYDLWLGPAADQPILRNKLHYDWHWDLNTGSGEMGNWGVHILDDIRNVAYQDSVTTPKSIVAAGGRVVWNDAANSPNVHFAFFETETFPTMITISNLPRTPNEKANKKGKQCGWSVRAGMPVDGPASGYVVVCEGGYYLGQRHKGRAVDLQGKTIQTFKGGDIVPLHVQNFVDSVRARDAGMLNAPVEMGHHSTGWANLANIAFHAGAAYNRGQLDSAASLEAWPLLIDEMEQQLAPFNVKPDQLVSSPVLKHDPATEQFVGEHAELGNQFLKRTYREKFVVPEISKS